MRVIVVLLGSAFKTAEQAEHAYGHSDKVLLRIPSSLKERKGERIRHIGDKLTLVDKMYFQMFCLLYHFLRIIITILES